MAAMFLMAISVAVERERNVSRSWDWAVCCYCFKNGDKIECDYWGPPICLRAVAGPLFPSHMPRFFSTGLEW